MKKLSILLFTITTCFNCLALAGQKTDRGESYITHNERYFQNNAFVSDFFGHVGALSGEIVKHAEGPDDHPIILLQLDHLENAVWIASVNSIKEEELTKGRKLRVLGFFDKSHLETQYIANLSESPEYLIGFCLHFEDTGLPVYHLNVLDKCKQWELGELDMQTVSLASEDQ